MYVGFLLHRTYNDPSTYSVYFAYRDSRVRLNCLTTSNCYYTCAVSAGISEAEPLTVLLRTHDWQKEFSIPKVLPPPSETALPTYWKLPFAML
eukprot:6217367-Pyramimonas_sp.AAC.1